ncbi:hypothetical protein LshimejAT787_1800150 [Lyophyllum shimeji]|uniref:Uncharacterized protein n=1 Tax=Lyophyllum shimeji TaxID=47721 RepID=A0A9P3UTJ5_LYOSH|nr:hypothetical protein LshimejAT787_1800150 [Lyophyllum shimeji]
MPRPRALQLRPLAMARLFRGDEALCVSFFPTRRVVALTIFQAGRRPEVFRPQSIQNHKSVITNSQIPVAGGRIPTGLLGTRTSSPDPFPLMTRAARRTLTMMETHLRCSASPRLIAPVPSSIFQHQD